MIVPAADKRSDIIAGAVIDRPHSLIDITLGKGDKPLCA